ncbi:hypothetical protein MNQ98_10665 [Paenibacillus sp. N3/727]|uniref:hypothetical protein n=1 Tax=Paenibacillus sp. N3/727 TaxID=2925845 RepID=UPI001F52D09F|nr:hypothetical protein [Paenibacillus sp. N3/727]UNK20437.1 hypothetical protein MNQ98_10665 [Paenibacillus sp. N3/727]
MKKFIVAVIFALGLSSVTVAPTHVDAQKVSPTTIAKKSQSKADKIKYYRKQIDKIESEIRKLESQRYKFKPGSKAMLASLEKENSLIEKQQYWLKKIIDLL